MKVGGLLTTNLTKSGTSCYLYFDKITLAKDVILAGKTIKDKINDGISAPSASEIDSGIFTDEDLDGTTYYYRGMLSDQTINNWLEFAGYKWRIIRINGENTIRIIFNGTDFSSTGNEAIISEKSYNSNSNDNMYVGFQYVKNQVHGYSNSGNSAVNSEILGADDSTDAKTLNGWYNTIIKGSSYEQYVDSKASFCNDRNPSTVYTSSNGQGGTADTNTFYGAYVRFYSTSPIEHPTFKCNEEDLFTTNTSNKGNKALANPIGLVTADEAIFSGLYGASNSEKGWMVIGKRFWTMTPGQFGSNGSEKFASTFHVDTYGYVGAGTNNPVNGYWGVRPVLNLKANVKLTGSGTTIDPFIIVN